MNNMFRKTLPAFLIAALAFAASGANAQGESSAVGAGRPQTEKGADGAKASSYHSFNLPVLTVRQRLSGKLQGHCSFLPLSVSVTSEHSPLRISFSDDTPNGSGATIRNSLWTAALIAALQKESALQGVRISLDFKGGMDGPSAGAMMCLGIMTALDGREFPEDFAMTGAILPDGTVGLVGGVSEKLKAAAASKKVKRVVIPAFQRFERDSEGTWIDLHELARGLGLELHPAESIGDAYRYLHGESARTEPIVSALSVCHESPEFENKAAEEFQKRDSEFRTRLLGLSSNDLKKVTGSWAWKGYIDPVNAERRFEEGAIFDALDLIAQADAYVSAELESWKFYINYYDAFIADAGAAGASLEEKDMHEWPNASQLAFIDGFREAIQELCERVLGWRENEEDSDKDDESDEPWRGFVPETGSSDLAAQLLSVVGLARAEGRYRYMDKQTFDRERLGEALVNGDRTIYDEISDDRQKLFFLMSERFKKPGFQNVPLPILNCGREVDSALELFRNAWLITDRMIETDVVDSLASTASAHRDTVRELLIGGNSKYAVYDAAKRWGGLFLRLFDEAKGDGAEFAYPGWTSSTFLFFSAELFAEASAQLLQLDGDTENASFMAFVMDRARNNALRSMEACRKAGIPCFAAVRSFQEAERNRANGTISASLVIDYWKATMSAKALVMAFKDGKGPKEGFSGYPAREEEESAKEATKATLDFLMNAECGALLDSLPTSWVKALSEAAALVAEKSDDATWNALRDLIKQMGILLVKRGGGLADLVFEDGEDAADGPYSKEDCQAVFENWGGRLLGVYSAATRETIAAGRLADVLRAPKRRLKNYDGAGRTIPLPDVEARMKADGSVSVSIPAFDEGATVAGLFDATTSTFRKIDGKMVDVDLIAGFGDCATWREKVASAIAEMGEEGTASLTPVLQALTGMLKKASDSGNADDLKAVFENFDWGTFFPDSDDGEDP